MISYKKEEIRDQLTMDDIHTLLVEFGGEPEYTPFGFLSATICHNKPGEGSRKLYFYENSHLFRCYTGCDSFFDIFELVIKVAKIQKNKEMNLNDAVRWIANKFGFSGQIIEEDDLNSLEDWQIFNNYDRIENIQIKTISDITLKEYDDSILNVLNYDVKISPWINEGMTQEVLNHAHIGYYPGADQISIPHYDKNGRFIGLRGRAIALDDIEKYGKYRPMKINGQLYNHPLGTNLYNFNNSKNNIKLMKKAIIVESEKSCLLYQSYFGIENDISVACCGSSISAYQMQELINCGVEEVIIGFDRQFQKIGDDEYYHLKNNLTKISEKYKNYVNVSAIFDKRMITSYKASPLDEGKDKFLKLFNERIKL